MSAAVRIVAAAFVAAAVLAATHALLLPDLRVPYQAYRRSADRPYSLSLGRGEEPAHADAAYEDHTVDQSLGQREEPAHTYAAFEGHTVDDSLGQKEEPARTYTAFEGHTVDQSLGRGGEPPHTSAAPEDHARYKLSGDFIVDTTHGDSTPGSPMLPDWTDDRAAPILARNHPGKWRSELGARLLRAADAHDAMQRCGSFLSTGDYTWCRKAMPKEANPAFKKQYGGVREYHMSGDGRDNGQPRNDTLVGLSFGIQVYDPWSELMSGLYFVKTELFDCFYGGRDGPMKHDWHSGHSPTAPCSTRHCYSEAYQPNRVCLDDSSGLEGLFRSTVGHKFQSLSTSLRDRKPLSTFVKMDVEGSEWIALERLLQSKEDLAKIRTLDMEVHFNLEQQVRQKYNRTHAEFESTRPTQESLTKHVEIMEGLAKEFAVTGSTIGNGMRKLIAGFRQKRAKHADFVTTPGHIVTENGLSLDQYCISFVNRNLL